MTAKQIEKLTKIEREFGDITTARPMGTYILVSYDGCEGAFEITADGTVWNNWDNTIFAV